MASIELENRTRAKFIFPITERRAAPAGSKRPGQLVEVDRVVIGDARDRDVPDSERDATRPNPVCVLTSEQWTRLGKRNQDAIAALVAKGHLVKHERAA